MIAPAPPKATPVVLTTALAKPPTAIPSSSVSGSYKPVSKSPVNVIDGLVTVPDAKVPVVVVMPLKANNPP